MAKLDPELLHKITRRGVAEIIPEAEFIARLEEGKPRSEAVWFLCGVLILNPRTVNAANPATARQSGIQPAASRVGLWNSS